MVLVLRYVACQVIIPYTSENWFCEDTKMETECQYHETPENILIFPLMGSVALFCFLDFHNHDFGMQSQGRHSFDFLWWHLGNFSCHTHFQH